MAFTRNWLKSLGLTEEQVSAVIEEHTTVTDSFKETLNKAKEEAETAKKEAAKIPELQNELNDLKGGEDYKAKYEKEHQDFEAFKADLTKKEEAEKVKTAYSKLLADEQIKADRIDFVVKHSDLSTVKLDKDGNLEDAEALKKTINDDWGIFKAKVTERKQNVPNPPEKGTAGTGISRAKELAQKYQAERYGVKSDTGKE